MIIRCTSVLASRRSPPFTPRSTSTTWFCRRPRNFCVSPHTLKSTYVHSNNGGVVPLNAFTHATASTSPLGVNHSSFFPSVTVSFNLAPGVSLGQATMLIDQMQRRIGVPASVRGTFAGTAQAFQKSLSTEPLLIITALLAIYIVLGMLYESLVHPITILTTLPSASVGAIIALILFHSELDVISIIGIFLLIGIVKKNAIMMIDFALIAEREHGKSTRDAIFEACMLRFRPILMTTMAALFGALPLAFGTGTGSELRRPLGVAIAGGLIFSQVLTLYTTPIIYLYFDRISNRFKRRRSDAPRFLRFRRRLSFECVSYRHYGRDLPGAICARLQGAAREPNRGFARGLHYREYAALRKRETGRPWPRRFAG